MDEKQHKLFLKNFKTKEGKSIEVPVEGALGLLSLGDIGLVAWRLKRQQSEEHNMLDNKNTNG